MTSTPISSGVTGDGSQELVEHTHPSHFPLHFAVEPDQIPSCISTPYKSMADYLRKPRKLKGKFSGSRSRSATPRPSIHQSGDNANMRIQTYNDVRGDQITYITNLGGML